jgi:cytochrome c-type biogenesis protein CcmF
MAIVGTFLVRSGILSSIHAFVSNGALNWAFVALIATMLASSVALVIWRRDQLRSEAKLDSLLSREAVFLFQNLVLVALALVIFWVTFFPLISKAITGTQVSVGPPAFRPFVVPLALIVVLLSGVGPVIAWRRVTLANLRRNFAFPLSAAAGTLILVLALVGTGASAFAFAMFGCGAFALAAVGQEFWRGTRARRAMSHEVAPVALAQLVRRNRRRYGGYLVHAGLAVLLIGVAGSTSFQHSRYATLMPGQSARIDGYTVRYARPTAAATAQKISLGAVLQVSKGRHRVASLDTRHELFPSQDASLGPIGRFFDGSDESRIGLKSGLTRDIWTVVNPSLQPIQGLISRGNAVFTQAEVAAMRRVAKLPTVQAQAALAPLWQARDRAIAELVARYVTHPWPVTFLMIVSPLVMWLWIGALIVIAGALIAVWPAPALARLRARSAAYVGRLAREPA